MAQYAHQTTVSVEKSVAEIKRTLDRYGAEQFAYGEDSGRGIASVQFAANARHVRFVLRLPPRDKREFWFTQRGKRTPQKALEAWEQACRQRWRALTLCIKAKLEAVDAGISEFEDEFLAHIVLPGGSTVSQLMRPQIAHAYRSGDPPPGIAGLLPAPNPANGNSGDAASNDVQPASTSDSKIGDSK